MKKGTIAFVGNYNIDQVNASGKRVKGLADAIRADYEVVFVGCSENGKFDKIIEIENGDRVAYFPTPTNIWKRLSVKKYLSFTLKTLESISELKGIISYGSPVLSIYVAGLQKWCKKRNVIFISDVVDMIFKNGKGGIFEKIKFWDTKYFKYKIIPTSDGIIAISNTIKEFYEKNGYKRIIIIPPVTSKEKNEKKIDTNRELVSVVYAGVPFNSVENIPKELMKDRLDWSIDLIQEVVKKGVFVELKIYGLTKEEFIYSLPEYGKILKKSNCIQFFGKVDQTRVESEIKSADFTILSRDKNEVTESGFPTKFSESLCMGTPVITTDTSDICGYLIEEKNGLLLDFGVTEDNVKKLYSILGNRKMIEKMKLYCENNYPFEPEKYGNQIKSLFK